jgi:quinol monooxygenase YgiN
MVSFVIRYRFASEDRAEAVEAARQLAIASRQEPGNIVYSPNQVEDDPDSLLILEQYADEKALAAHRASEHFKKYAIGVLAQKMKERAVENLVSLA